MDTGIVNSVPIVRLRSAERADYHLAYDSRMSRLGRRNPFKRLKHLLFIFTMNIQVDRRLGFDLSSFKPDSKRT